MKKARAERQEYIITAYVSLVYTSVALRGYTGLLADDRRFDSVMNCRRVTTKKNTNDAAAKSIIAAYNYCTSVGPHCEERPHEVDGRFDVG